jgi:hypothetical protein
LLTKIPAGLRNRAAAGVSVASVTTSINQWLENGATLRQIIGGALLRIGGRQYVGANGFS